MELGSIVQFLDNKAILVTGATGFLASILVEKILRVQPNVKKLFLLLRAADTSSAIDRLHNEVLEKELFKVLREKWGSNLDSLISEKVIPVPGDISFDNLGIEDSRLRDQMWTETDIFVNSAATTKFDERYDIALGINTLGARNVINFAKKCVNLKILIHVSTAYVCGERAHAEVILESPFFIGQTLDGSSKLDIEAEVKLVEEARSKLCAEGAGEEARTKTMKCLGLDRARLYGWPNTYVFTKAMGEMIIGHLKDNLPLVVLRPPIITSTYKEPFPSWMEGLRTFDIFAISYGKGKLPCFLGDPDSILDVVPADMVVNLLLVAMVAHANKPVETIYHIGSSSRNPLKLLEVRNFIVHYFTQHPWINENGLPLKVGKPKQLRTMASFRRHMTIHYLLPLKALQLVNNACCHHYKAMYRNYNRKIKFVMKVIEIYRPYVFFKGIFDDTNAEKLRLYARECNVELDDFYFDPSRINWEDYFMNTHLPGLMKYICKQ